MTPRMMALLAFLVAFAARAVLIAEHPDNFSFDAFQRWAGRDVLLVQGWLPTTQALIALVARLGGGILAVRLTLAAVAAVGVAAGAWVAERIAGRVAGLGFLILSCFAPSMVWTGAMYQEGTYATVLYLGLACAVSGRLTLADLIVGAIGLVRYEGWPAVLLWILWRRDPRALAGAWGIVLWLVGRTFLHWKGHAFSPVDFDDWEAMEERTTIRSWTHDAGEWLLIEWLSGGFVVLGFAAAGLATRWRDRWVGYMALNFGAQLAALAGWLAGLEVATYRMLVVPTLVLMLPGAIGVAWVWERLPKLRVATALGLAAFLGVAGWEARREASVESRLTAPERNAALLMKRTCEACVWRVLPRRKLGTRDRHDGCEVLQGTTMLRQGIDFACVGWPGHETLKVDAGLYWDGLTYVADRTHTGDSELAALAEDARAARQRARMMRSALLMRLGAQGGDAPAAEGPAVQAAPAPAAPGTPAPVAPTGPTTASPAPPSPVVPTAPTSAPPRTPPTPP
jgi:hypothetical protein